MAATLRQNNDIGRLERARAAVKDTFADFAGPVTVTRAGALLSTVPGLVVSNAHSRVASANSVTLRFLYTILLAPPVDVAKGDVLGTNGATFLVGDFDNAGTLSASVMTVCLCQRL